MARICQHKIWVTYRPFHSGFYHFKLKYTKKRDDGIINAKIFIITFNLSIFEIFIEKLKLISLHHKKSRFLHD